MQGIAAQHTVTGPGGAQKQKHRRMCSPASATQHAFKGTRTRVYASLDPHHIQ